MSYNLIVLVLNDLFKFNILQIAYSSGKSSLTQRLVTDNKTRAIFNLVAL